MEAIALCEAAGYDRILVETVGVGQSEIAVAHITDMLALLVPPAGGDELQGMKKGIVEMADLVIVNKADGSLKTLANHAKVEYMHALQLLRHKSPNWTPMVQTCSSIEKDGSLDVIMSAINQYKDTMVASGELFEQRKTQRRKWMWDQLHEELIDVLRQEPSVGSYLQRFFPGSIIFLLAHLEYSCYYRGINFRSGAQGRRKPDDPEARRS
jgi:LAO/AO transport system kinase